MIIINFWIIIVTVKRTVFELKQIFYDVFKLLQYMFALIYLVSIQLFYIGILFYANNDFLNIIDSFYFIMMNYYFLNQLVGYVMIIHLVNYKTYTPDGKKYRYIKEAIKRKEKLIFLFLIIFIIFSFIVEISFDFMPFGL